MKISRNKNELDRLIYESKIVENEPRLEKYLCLVLMTELLFGAGHLNGDSKPVQCIRKYEPTFRKLLAESNDNSASAKNINDDNTSSSTGNTNNDKGTNFSFYICRYIKVVS